MNKIALQINQETSMILDKGLDFDIVVGIVYSHEFMQITFKIPKGYDYSNYMSVKYIGMEFHYENAISIINCYIDSVLSHQFLSLCYKDTDVYDYIYNEFLDNCIQKFI